MQIKHVSIQCFRGIRALTWTPGGDILCLIGPGDSTKTTILDAIEFALSPRWSVPVLDTDFHNGDCSTPVQIDVTVGGLPKEFLDEDGWGLELRGWHPTQGLKDEPANSCEPVITIRLTIDEALEPSWVVFNERHPAGKPIAWKDRRRLGVVRLGNEVETHLAWGRGSALTRLTANQDEVGAILASAYRTARDAVAGAPLKDLASAAVKAEEAIERIGVPNASGYKAGLDARLAAFGYGALALHDGNVPLRAIGLGSRRLAALALQRLAVPEGAIVLMDEVEHGLEPHRIRRFLKNVRVEMLSAPPLLASSKQESRYGQFITTSHSPIVIEELKCENLRVVRASSGETKILSVPSELQGAVRAHSHALLSRKIIVCEGATEVGLLRGVQGSWASNHDGLDFGYHGISLCNGGGRTRGPDYAVKLSTMGYPVAYFGDSDEPIKPPEADLVAAGVKVVLWGSNLHTESRIFLDLPIAALQEIVNASAEELGDVLLLANINSALKGAVKATTLTLSELVSPQLSEAQLREALATAAHGGNGGKNAWFKRTDLGEHVGTIIASQLSIIPTTDLAVKLNTLERWVYG